MLKICPLPYLPSNGRLLTRTPSSFKTVGIYSPNEVIDMDVFEQVRELDEDEDGFSKVMVDEYLDQAVQTFEKMDVALCAFIATLSTSAP